MHIDKMEYHAWGCCTGIGADYRAQRRFIGPTPVPVLICQHALLHSLLKEE